jgi:hypothetical protein
MTTRLRRAARWAKGRRRRLHHRLQQGKSERPLAMPRLDVDVPRVLQAHELAAPGARIGAGQPRGAKRVVGARDEDVAIRQRPNGTGAKSFRMARRSGSAGATSSAPRIRAAASSGKWLVAMHPRLCAAITTGPGVSRICCASDATHAARWGDAQSSCTMRRAPGRRPAHRLCQCPGPQARHPGTMSTVGEWSSRVCIHGFWSTSRQTRTTDL